MQNSKGVVKNINLYHGTIIYYKLLSESEYFSFMH